MHHRSSFGLFAFAVMASFLGYAAQPAQAQKKNNDGPELAKAQKRINALEQDVREREQKIDQLQALLKRFNSENNADDKRIKILIHEIQEREKKINVLEVELKRSRSDDKKDDQQTGNLKKDLEKLRSQIKDLETTEKANLVHAAFYRLKPNIGEAEAKSFLENTPRVLGKLPGVRVLWVGKPYERSLAADGTEYHVGVIAVFDNADSLRRFQSHPMYKKFEEGLRKKWEPMVYDILRDQP